jgi:hypothetical protein
MPPFGMGVLVGVAVVVPVGVTVAVRVGVGVGTHPPMPSGTQQVLLTHRSPGNPQQSSDLSHSPLVGMQQDPSTQSAVGSQQSVSAVQFPPVIAQQVSFSHVTPEDEQQSWKELHPVEPRGMQQEPPTQSAVGAQQSVSAAHAPPFRAQQVSF